MTGLRERLAPWLRAVRALALLSPYLLRVRRRADLRQVMRSYLGPMPLCLFSEPGRWARMVATSTRRYRQPSQRPRSLYIPHLSAVPFPEPDEVARTLESSFETIAAEFERVSHLDEDSPALQQALVGQGAWTRFPLVQVSAGVTANIERCPGTWSTIRPLGPLYAYFSILAPGTHVLPHCGASNLRRRYHLGIEGAEGARIRCDGTWRTWERGRCLVFDDSFEHEVVHDGDRRRSVLLLDCWHPELSPSEREFITEVLGVWREGIQIGPARAPTARR
jgi:aspartate beta-hydroxylase